MQRCLALFSAVLLAITCPPPTSAQQTGAAQSQSVQVQGLRERVLVRRDERGIPYISAIHIEDLYFAQGYATAADRLWQMDLLRRTARGELAEILGNNALEEDKRHRTFGFAQTADAELAQATPAARAVLEAYTRGVNTYIAGLDAKDLPPEFQILQYKPRPWTAADSLVVVKLFFESLSSTWRLDVMREAFADLPAQKRAALMPVTSPLDVLVVGKDRRELALSKPFSVPAERTVSADTLRFLKIDEERMSQSLARVGLAAENLAASNNWVVSGKHSASGKPLLANDPHLSPSAPPIWHLVHLSAPGFRVAGVTAPGLPGVIIGHNDRIAWGFTNVGPDVQDLYIEKFDPGNPGRYLTPSGWRDAEIRHEEIKVRKGFTDSATDTVTIDVTVTRHGPIVLEKDSKRYALRWTALDPKLNNAIGVYLLNRARNWREFTAAIRSYTPPMQNMVYADVDGHIGHYAAGVVPIRASGDGSVPYDGSKDDGEWISFIPFDKLPHLYNPPSGMIVTANQRIVGTDYPYFLTHSWAQPYRARRILDLLKQKKRMTANDFRAILGDTYSIAASAFAREAAKSLKEQASSRSDEKLRESIAAFERWDGRLNAEARVAPLVAQMRMAFRSKIIMGALGPERARVFAWSNFDTTLDRIITSQPRDWLPPGFKTYSDLYLACYEEGRQTLTKSLGGDETKWVWGELVKARFPHPLAMAPLVGLPFTVPPVPQNGTGALVGATVNVGAAVSMRLIADPSDWDMSQHGISLGQSGIPTSPHWTDQLADWRAVTPRVFPFTDGAIEKATRRTMLLQPKERQETATTP
ncbi:MAG: penicillin acylase family protein [Pyrinomonadaceae bacterium]|nr:penicillin acylase family protein [Pyrinomonadaceae bacterium]